MDLRLTEIMCCSRCGPPHALVLLAHRVEEQRVHEGVLGCPSCSARYPVRLGCADLRPPQERGAEDVGAGSEIGGAEPALEPGSAAAAGERATRLAALMGMGQLAGSRFALVVGACAGSAPAMAALVPESEVVAVGPGVGAWPEAAGVSRVEIGPRLPFFDASMRGVALTGPAAATLVEEGVRVLDPMGRLLLEPAPPDAAARLARAGARVVAREGETVVAVRVRAG